LSLDLEDEYDGISINKKQLNDNEIDDINPDELIDFNLNYGSNKENSSTITYIDDINDDQLFERIEFHLKENIGEEPYYIINVFDILLKIFREYYGICLLYIIQENKNKNKFDEKFINLIQQYASNNLNETLIPNCSFFYDKNKLYYKYENTYYYIENNTIKTRKTEIENNTVNRFVLSVTDYNHIRELYLLFYNIVHFSPDGENDLDILTAISKDEIVKNNLLENFNSLLFQVIFGVKNKGFYVPINKKIYIFKEFKKSKIKGIECTKYPTGEVNSFNIDQIELIDSFRFEQELFKNPDLFTSIKTENNTSQFIIKQSIIDKLFHQNEPRQ
jgi:hypothetical protein